MNRRVYGRAAGALGVAVISVALVACSKKNTNNFFGFARNDTITVSNGGISPQQLTLSTGTVEELHITNKSSKDCTFFVSDYLQPELLPAGKSAIRFFTITTPSGGPTSPGTFASMGCQNDSQRQGSVDTRFTGPRPGGQ